MSIPVDTPGEYARSLLHRLGDRDMLSVLETSIASVREEFAGLDDAAIRRPEADGKWSMLEVAHHLADGELVIGVRIRMIVAHDEPPIVAYDQDLWSQKLHYRDAKLSDVLEQFAVMRAANVRVANQLTGDDFKRVGIHTERGAESVAYTLRLLAGHDLVHIDQLARIRRAVK